MQCPLQSGERVELTVGYVARTLDPETELSFEGHAASCAVCRQAVDAQQAVWLALDAWPDVLVSPDFETQVCRRIEQVELASEPVSLGLHTLPLPA